MDLDIVALQISIVRLGPDRFVTTALNKLGVESFLSVPPSDLASIDAGSVKANMSLLESLLQLLCVSCLAAFAHGPTPDLGSVSFP